MRRSLTVIEQKAKGWRGFSEPPPYPILMVDEIMASVMTADEFERARTAEERSAALLRKELTGLRTRNADAMAVLIALRYEVLGEKCGIPGIKFEL